MSDAKQSDKNEEKPPFSPPPPDANRANRVTRSGPLSSLLDQLASGSHLDEGGVGSPPALPPKATFAPAGRPSSSIRVMPSSTRALVDPKICRPWKLADRPLDEYDDSGALARSLKNDGQVQPCTVRPCVDPSAPEIKFEVIAGARRWKSALDSQSELEVVIRQLDDKAAYKMMAAENDFRRDLSDFARSTRFARALSEGIAKDPAELAEMSGLSRSEISYFLGFSSLPIAVLTAFGRDIAKLPLRVGYAISVACKKGYTESVIRDAQKLLEGKITVSMIPAVWQEEGVTSSSPRVSAVQRTVIQGSSGKPLFTVERGSSKTSLKFDPSVKLDDEIIGAIAKLIERSGPQ